MTNEPQWQQAYTIEMTYNEHTGNFFVVFIDEKNQAVCNIHLAGESAAKRIASMLNLKISY